jgi:hypothetical protein
MTLLPLYFLEENQGTDFPPPLAHPEHFYGFIGVALASGNYSMTRPQCQ